MTSNFAMLYLLANSKSNISIEIGERCETVTQCIEGKGKLENGRCKCEDRWTGIFCQSRMCHNGISVGSGGQVMNR